MPLKKLLAALIDRTLKQRAPGSDVAYRVARRVIAAYENCDVDMATNGEQWLQRLVFNQGNITAFDVGANVGDWLMPLAGLPADFRVFAYEAAPATFEKLQKNVSDPRVALINRAMSSRPETLIFRQVKTNHYVSSVYDTDDWVEQKDVDVIEIEATCGDSEIKAHGVSHVGFVKIDVEGHDLQVIRGFSGAIGRDEIDFIQFEYNGYTLRAGASLRDFYNALHPRFVICRLLPRGLEATAYSASLDNFHQSNWVAVRRSAITPDLVQRLSIRPAKGYARGELIKRYRSDPDLLHVLGCSVR